MNNFLIKIAHLEPTGKKACAGRAFNRCTVGLPLPVRPATIGTQDIVILGGAIINMSESAALYLQQKSLS